MNFLRRNLKKLKRAGEDFVHYTADVIYDRRDGFGTRIYAGFLKALSFVFSSIVRMRHYMYDSRILRDAPLGCTVVVVGRNPKPRLQKQVGHRAFALFQMAYPRRAAEAESCFGR